MPRRPIEIDLSGPDGNAYALVGYENTWKTAWLLGRKDKSDYQGCATNYDGLQHSTSSLENM